MTQALHYRLLGPPVIVSGGDLLEVGSSRERIILSMLLLHANQVVPIHRLVDAIWEDRPPTTARSQIQHCISALRRQVTDAGATGEIVTSTAGYAINVPAEAIDVALFERLAQQGRAALAETQAEDAIASLRTALKLWRGPACAGVPSQLVQTFATRLNEDRLRVLEDCLDLELGLGRHRDLVGELSELVRQHPTRERLRALHMLALYRSARKAEALDSFREARSLLVEELGLDPGGDLCALQRAILADDQALAGVSQVSVGARGASVIPRQLPAVAADFTGRTKELELATALLTPADDQQSADYLPVVVLTGKGGVGKTTLALRAAHTLRGAYPDGQLFAQLRDAEGEPISSYDLLGQFLRSLGAVSAPLPQTLAERTNLYRSLVADRRIMVVLDDADSVVQATALLPGYPSCCVIITSRGQLAGLPGAYYLEIGDLDEATSVELLANLIGADRLAAEPDAANRLVRLCGYLPLALRIVGAKLAERPYWRLDELVRRMTDEGRRLDELSLGSITIRATLSFSYRSISPSARRLFRRLGMLGTSTFSPWVSAPLLDADAASAAEVLDLLVQARLVEVRLSKPGPPRFHLHELVRVYALECLAGDEPAADRSAALQRTLGCWLALAVEAHKRIYGGNYATLHGDAVHFRLPQAVQDSLLAKPLEWLHSEKAALVMAVLQAAQAGLDELSWDLAVTLVALFESGYQVDDWRRTHQAALEITRKTGNLQGEAAILYSLGIVSITEHLGQAVRYFQSAQRIFEQLDHAHGTALSCAGLAFADRIRGQHQAAQLNYERALRGFRFVGDRIGEVDALTSLAQIQTEQGNFDVARELLETARGICGSLDAPRIVAQTEHRLAEFFLRTGQYQDSERSFSYVLQVVRESGDLVGEAYALHGLASVHAEQGRYATAEAEYNAALDLSVHVGNSLLRARVLLAYAELHARKGEPMMALPLIDSALALLGDADGATVWQTRGRELRAQLTDAG